MEVLVAVIIIGLGALGLSAMFAGAAGQQRRADVVNQSVQLAQNAQAMVLRSFGRMEGATAVEPGVWRPAVADDEEYFLTTADRAYFVVPASPFIAFQQSFQQFQNTGRQFPTPANFLLPHGRIDRQNLSVVVTVTEAKDPLLGLGAPKSDSFLFAEDNNPPVTGDPDPINLFLDGDSVNFTQRITFNRAESLQVGGARGGLGIDASVLTSLINEFQTTQSVVQAFVSNIEVQYSWRNDNLVSLGDRFLFQQDERMPGGRRPHLGYTLLTRTTPAGVSQLAILTYALEPLAVPTPDLQLEPIFIPPETQTILDSELGLLRSAEVELRWDRNTDQFFIVASDPDEDGWVIEQGQMLLVGESLTSVGGEGPAGADGAVRIVAVRRVRASADEVELQGVLDGSPRVLGRSPLRTLNSSVTLLVWAFPATVESLTTDETEWAIRPIEARVVQALAP